MVEKEIEEEVITFTKEAHSKKVDLVKTKETLGYEITTIRKSITEYKKETEKVKKTIDTLKEKVKGNKDKISGLKEKLKGVKTKTEIEQIETEITVYTTEMVTFQEEWVTYTTTYEEWESKIIQLADRRKQIKYIIEVKVLESKEAEQTVYEAIKTVTDIELLNRKRWLA